MNLEKWPLVEGRYTVGNKNSPIAVCTNASIDEIEVDLKKVAIIGKCVTENIGIERIIQNIVSNSNIRYLILCGRNSKGHFVSQAIEALIENGIDKEKRIIGAKGNMPYLKNIDGELVERFRKQIKAINYTGEIDSKKIGEIIDDLLKGNVGKFKGKAFQIEETAIEAEPAKWISDPNGYFLVFIDKEKNRVILEHYQNGRLNKKIYGKNAKEICDTVAELKLVGNFEQTLEHAMYLARELQKAELALKENLDFEQNEELKITKVAGEKKPTDEYGWFD